MNKYILIIGLFASTVLVTAYTHLPVIGLQQTKQGMLIADDDTPSWKKRQTEILEHISGHLGQLHKQRDCADAATTFEELLNCHPAATDSSLCMW